MSLDFTQHSIAVCRDFLQTAVIIDDRAFHKPTVSQPKRGVAPTRGKQKAIDEHTTSAKQERFLNTTQLIKGFAENGIICSALEFVDFKNDAPAFKATAKSADITIIDWELEEEKTGKYALELISSLLKDDIINPRQFRLITIYTAKIDLAEISEEISSHFEKFHNIKLTSQKNGLFLVYNSIVISIYAKDPHGIPPHLQFNAVDEAGLPERLIACFAESVSGILPNTALAALTAIRHSTHRLLGQFNKRLDYAFLTHRASLPVPDDAAFHLEELIGEEIKSILSSYDCIGLNASFTTIKKWIIEKYVPTHKFNCRDGTQLNRDEVLKCLKEGSEKADTHLTKNKKKQLYQHFSYMLTNSENESSQSDISLSNLSILKTRYNNQPPHLALGIIIQQPKDKSIWLCIQPRCDAVRLEDESKSKKFPLLPILPGKGKKSLTIPRLNTDEGDLFSHIPIHLQHCRCVEFCSARQDLNQILPRKVNGDWYYTTTEKGLRFRFVAELKDEIVQSLMNELASTTARVGTNPSEWLRKNGVS